MLLVPCDRNVLAARHDRGCMGFPDTDAAQVHLFLEDEAPLDHEYLFHDRNDRRVALLANGRYRIDRATDRHAFYVDPFMNKIFCDDLFMMLGRQGRNNAPGFDPSSFNRKPFGQKRDRLFLDHARIVPVKPGFFDRATGRHHSLPEHCAVPHRTCDHLHSHLERRRSEQSEIGESHREVTRRHRNEPHPYRHLMNGKGPADDPPALCTSWSQARVG